MDQIRVWCENGDLIGYADVKLYASFRVEVGEAPQHSGYDDWEFAFGTRAEAESYAREWAQGLAEWARGTCACRDDCPDGCTADYGISIQECGD